MLLHHLPTDPLLKLECLLCCLLLLFDLLFVLCATLQDPVWAEQAVVFPSWREYSRDLENRAALADRRWLDSIDGPDSNAENKYYNQMQQQEKKIGIGKLITS